MKISLNNNAKHIQQVCFINHQLLTNISWKNSQIFLDQHWYFDDNSDWKEEEISMVLATPTTHKLVDMMITSREICFP
jgi:hypothetical protein